MNEGYVGATVNEIANRKNLRQNIFLSTVLGEIYAAFGQRILNDESELTKEQLDCIDVFEGYLKKAEKKEKEINDIALLAKDSTDQNSIEQVIQSWKDILFKVKNKEYVPEKDLENYVDILVAYQKCIFMDTKAPGEASHDILEDDEDLVFK